MKSNFYSIEEFMIDDIPVPSYAVKSLALFLDIDKVGIQLSLTFNDITNIKTMKPIKGGETITLSVVDRYEKRFRGEFILTTFNAIAHSAPKDVLTVLSGVSKIGYECATQRIATSYDGMTVSDIVKTIIPDAKVSDTSSNFQVICPGWTKTKFLEHLSRIAYSDKYKGMFLCWEDFDGVQFKSLNEVYKEQTSVNSYLTNNRNPYYRYNILEYREINNTPLIQSAVDNVFQKTYVCYNPETKQMETKQIKLDDDGKKFEKLGKGNLFSDSASELANERPILVGRFDDATMKAKYENQMRFAEYTRKIHILINGEFSNNPGTLIDIQLAERYAPSELDVDIGGIWLIEKVACHMSGDDFIQKIQLTRNASYDYTSKNTTVVNPSVN